MNHIILISEILITFSLLLFSYKVFKKEGVIAWIAVAFVLANLVTAKNAEIFGLTTAIGSVLFASTFLATDILTERYGAETARRAVYIGLFSNMCFIVASQIALAYIPSSVDYADGAMRTLFTMNFRITAASMLMYFIANLADVWLYDKLRKRTGGRYMWLRNNVSTILCNCLENFFFMALGFLGMYDLKTVITMAISTSVIEMLIGVCDTPFLYLAVGIKRGVKNGKTTEKADITRAG